MTMTLTSLVGGKNVMEVLWMVVARRGGWGGSEKKMR